MPGCRGSTATVTISHLYPAVCSMAHIKVVNTAQSPFGRSILSRASGEISSCSSSPLPSHLSNRSWWWTNLIERLHHCQMAAHGEPAIAKSFNAEFVAAQTTGSLKECWTSRHM